MTRDEIIKWLDSYVKLASERAGILELIAALEEDRAGSQLQSPKLDGMPRSGRISDPTAASAMRLGALLERYEEAAAALYDRMACIEEAISALDSPQQRLMLREHYIAGLDWESVAVKHSYSVSRCTQLAGEGITELCEVLANE